MVTARKELMLLARFGFSVEREKGKAFLTLKQGRAPLRIDVMFGDDNQSLPERTLAVLAPAAREFF